MNIFQAVGGQTHTLTKYPTKRKQAANFGFSEALGKGGHCGILGHRSV